MYTPWRSFTITSCINEWKYRIFKSMGPNNTENYLSQTLNKLQHPSTSIVICLILTLSRASITHIISDISHEWLLNISGIFDDFQLRKDTLIYLQSILSLTWSSFDISLTHFFNKSFWFTSLEESENIWQAIRCDQIFCTLRLYHKIDKIMINFDTP